MAKRVWLILLFSIVAWAERCDPPAQITAFLNALPDDNTERRKLIGESLKSSPGDFWLNMSFLDGSVYQRSAVREKYRLKFQENRTLENQYLYGRSLVGFDTIQALRLYSEVLEKDPDNPWVHYSQLEIYRSEAFRDRAKMRDSFEAVTRACPSWTEPYRFLTALDVDGFAPLAVRLRKMLEASKKPRDLRLYPALWAVEFRLNLSEQKSRVAADLKRLREIGGTQAVIAAGAKLIGDEALAKEMTPPGSFNVFEEQRSWQQSHPYPKDEDLPEKKRAYAEAELEISTTLIANAPRDIAGYSHRFHALEILDAPVDEIGRAADDVVQIARTNDRAGGGTFIANMAHVFVTRGILLDRVPALIEEALRMFDDPEAVIEIDLAPSHDRTLESRMNFASWHVSALVTLSEYYQKLEKMEKARSVLAPVPAFLARLSAPKGVLHNFLLFHALANYSYWKRVAEIDEHESRKEDALREYRQALLVWDGERDKLMARPRRLWKDLGRSDEAWQAWVDGIPRPAWKEQKAPRVGFVTVHRPLPRVGLKDLDGVEWPPDRLAKTTIATVWATWCQPCRAELPYFAKLAERLNSRTDIQVVSLNTDENPETAKQFMKKNGYKFAVLSAKNFAEDLMPYFSIPRTWIIRDRVIVEEEEGFGGDGDQWVEQLELRTHNALAF